MDDQPAVLTAEEVADLFRVSVHTVRRWCRESKVPHMKIGGSFRFRQDTIDALMAEAAPEKVA